MYRVLAHHKENMVLSGLFTGLYAIMIAAWVAVATQWRAVGTPSTAPYGTNCSLSNLPSWSPVSWAATVAFMLAILIFTLVLWRDHTPRKSKAGHLIYRELLGYIVVSLAAAIAVLVLDSLDTDLNRIKVNGIPFATLIFYAMGSRIFLNYRLLLKRQMKEQGVLPTGTFGPAITRVNVGAAFPGSPESFHPISKHDPNEAPFASYAPTPLGAYQEK